MSWTDEERATAIRLWNDGHSAGQIVGHFKRKFSRNAVIGIIHRAGLSRSSRKTKPGRVPRMRRTRKAVPPVAPINRQKEHRDNVGRAFGTRKQADPSKFKDPLIGAKSSIADPPHDFVGPPYRMTIATMPLLGACRWPIGDPGDDGFHFCGAACDASASYCEAHARIAYTGTVSSAKRGRKSKTPDPQRAHRTKLNFRNNEERYG